MRIFLWTMIASAALLGVACNQDETNRTTTNNATGTGTNSSATDGANRTTVSKPALGGGETGVAPDAGSTTTDGTNEPVRPDNTAVNERDRDEDAVTPESQSNAQEDLNMTAEIRQRILRNDDISVNGRNVKVITTEDHKVVLRGPVASEEEKKMIEDIAREEAGEDKVTSHLEIAK